MKTTAENRPFSSQPLIKPVYLIVLLMLGLTGFSQLPIMKRYYIADVPGLGWLADFYVTHTMHYIGAAMLFFVLAYIVATYLVLDRKRFKLTVIGYIRIILIAVLVISGIFRVLKNLPNMFFSPDFVLLIDFTHLGLAMLLILTGIYALVRRSRWLQEKNHI